MSQSSDERPGSMLRKRSKRQYKEISSEGESSPEGVPLLPHSTSSLKNEHIEHLGLKFINTEKVADFLGDANFIKLCPDQELLSPGIILPPPRSMTDIQIKQSYPRTFNLIRSLQELTRPLQSNDSREWQTDTFVNKVLAATGFDDFPFLLQIKPYLKGLIAREDRVSIPDHGIMKDRTTIIINENKRENITLAMNNFGEAQLAGEMIIAAENIRSSGEDRIIYGIRVLGTHFSFYRAIFNHDYITNIRKFYPAISEAIIFRYPAEDYDVNDINQLRTLDYCDPQEREIILSLLYSIKGILEQ